MPPFKDYREESRKNWGADQEQSLDRGQLTGAIVVFLECIEQIGAVLFHPLPQLQVGFAVCCTYPVDMYAVHVQQGRDL